MRTQFASILHEGERIVDVSFVLLASYRYVETNLVQSMTSLRATNTRFSRLVEPSRMKNTRNDKVLAYREIPSGPGVR